MNAYVFGVVNQSTLNSICWLYFKYLKEKIRCIDPSLDPDNYSLQVQVRS